MGQTEQRLTTTPAASLGDACSSQHAQAQGKVQGPHAPDQDHTTLGRGTGEPRDESAVRVSDLPGAAASADGDRASQAEPAPTRLARPEAVAAEDSMAAWAVSLAAFKVLIWRYTGASEVVVEVTGGAGTPASRKTITVKTCLDDDPTVGEALGRVSRALDQACDSHRLRPDCRDGPATFAWRKPDEAAGQASQSGAFSAMIQVAACQRPMKLVHHEVLCPGTTAALIEGHFQQLLAGMAGDPSVPVGKLPWLSQSEQNTILHQWSGQDHDPELARDEMLHELFEAQADAHPGNIAVICGDQQMTYAELEHKANQMARHLRSQGVGRGSFVAILLPRSSDVYVALLAILKSGAAYVPLDAEYPADRVAYILGDCKVHTLVTTSALAAKLTPGDHALFLMDKNRDEASRESGCRLTRADTQATPSDLCYVIYTSGSTGRPKGVQIEHRSVCNLVRAEGRIYGIRPDDRVYQGLTIAFDASVEELWLAWFAGAALVVGTLEMVRAGPAMPRLLSDAKVTVLSTVPTLLSMMEDDVPTLRVLILGGEVCPPDLVRRWYKPGRRLVNSYGPTEATVVATLADCDPDNPVTIGRPVPNYRVYLLDRHMQPVPVGVPGEIHIGGVGLSRGYLGKPDLTAEAFVADPFAAGDPSARLYKTGDLGRYTLEGQIEFLGRIDTQVKLRGFRVELAEIECVLMQHPAVLSAAVALREDVPGIQQLVGYLVPRENTAVDEDAIKERLRGSLPAYMVPAVLETVSDLPTLACGKVDRKRLPPPQPRHAKSKEASQAPQTSLEKKIAGAWARLFKVEAICVSDDFFLDLGGHSLLAAIMVSQLRKDPDFRDLSVPDVYSFPTARALAAEFESRRQTAPAEDAKPLAGDQAAPSSRVAHLVCGCAQAVGLYFVLGFYALQWLTPYLTYGFMIDHEYSVVSSILAALGILLLLDPVLIVTSIVIKWVVLGRVKPGNYPLWSFYYFRWWLVNQILEAVQVDFLSGTPLLSIYYRLMGARIGSNVYFGTDAVSTFDLLSIGDDSSVGFEASLLGYTVENGMLKIGPISIGQRCYVGARSMVCRNVRMEDDSSLGDLSMLPEGTRLPAGQTCVGSPARAVAQSEAEAARRAIQRRRPGRLVRALYGTLHAIGTFILPVVYLAAVFPGVMLMNYLGREYEGYWFILASPLVAISFVVLMSLEIVLVKWLLLGRVKPGRYALDSFFYLRKWFVDQLMDLSLDLLGPLYATLYFNPWYRLLGAKLGKNAEVSTACATSPDLLSIAEETFVADSVSLGVARVDQGFITIAPTQIGKRAFVGNSALIPAGSVIGDGSLIGCLSTPPLSSPGAAQPDTFWVGSPAIFLPQRQTSTSFSEETTFRPTRRLYLLRAFIEFFRVILPATCLVALTGVLISAVILIREQVSPAELALLFPLVYLGCGIVAALIVVLCKWVLMGRIRPTEKPLWNSFVWRAELLVAMHEHLANPFLLEMLTGTPFVCWFFRLLGSKIGSRVYMETLEFTEFDLVSIGDDVTLNFDCTIQTHLFEDRVMKMSTIRIGCGCSVGAGSVVLYDTELEPGAMLHELSLLMKGETLPAFTHWGGTPARPAAPRPSAPQQQFEPAGRRPHWPMRLLGKPKKVCGDPHGPSRPWHRRSGGRLNRWDRQHPEFLSQLDQYNPVAPGPHVWVLDLDDEAHQRLFLPHAARAGKRRQASRHLSSVLQKRRLVSRALTRYLVGRHLNVDPAQVALRADAHGKLAPAIDRMPDCPKAKLLDLNVAHSENVYLAGLSFSGRIGVDVEVIRPEVDMAALAAVHFSPAEWQRIQSLPPDDRLLAFYNCWTAKEAFVKALGLGLSFGLEQVETAPQAKGIIRIASVSGSEQLAEGWELVHRRLSVGGVSAVAAVVFSR